MPREIQEEFLFSGDASEAPSFSHHPLEDFFAEVAKAWSLPVGQLVKVRLSDAGMPELSGRLELARAPDLPLDPRQPLALRLSGVDFFHREIVAWILLG